MRPGSGRGGNGGGWLAGLVAVVLISGGQAQGPLTLVTNFYPVRGATLAEIAASLWQSAPGPDDEVDEPFVARTTWQVGSSFQAVARGGGSVCEGFSTRVRITVRLPRWEAPAGVEPAVHRAWTRYLDALQVHEAGHVSNALAAVAEIHRAVREIGWRRDSQALRAAVTNEVQAVVERFRANDAAYDARTGHGLGQGAVLLSDPSRAGWPARWGATPGAAGPSSRHPDAPAGMPVIESPTNQSP